MNTTILLISFLFGYQWPMKDSLNNSDNMIIESNLGDFRSGSYPRHIHEGLDIPNQWYALRDSLYIYSIDTGIVVIKSAYTLKIRHYSKSQNNIIALNEGSRYLHASTGTVCDLGDTIYLYTPIARGWEFDPTYSSHLHLEYKTGDTNFLNTKNPFFLDTLQLHETMLPELKYLYVDDNKKGNATVNNFNFLGYSFDTLYSDTTYQSVTFKKLKLKNIQPEEDLLQPHIFVTGNRKVKFIVEGHDNFYNSNDRGAPYELSLFLFDIDSSGVLLKPYYTLRFDSLAAYHDEVHLTEDIYHYEPPCTSGINAPQYYRLYPYDYFNNGYLPQCIVTGFTELKTDSLPEGLYRIRISSKDYRSNIKTADIHMYIKYSNTNWVDLCRGFK